MLDEAERNRAATLNSSAQHDRFVAGRIALLLHAAELAGVSPGSLRADYFCPCCQHQNKAHGMPRYPVPPIGACSPAPLTTGSLAWVWTWRMKYQRASMGSRPWQ